MLDIGRFGSDEPPTQKDPAERDLADNMYELPAWSPKKAMQTAAEEGIELTEEHWAVIFSLREWFREHGPAASAREMAVALEHELFPEGGGRQQLYELFPGGPISQGSRIAGLPKPPFSTDRSFGSFL